LPRTAAAKPNVSPVNINVNSPEPAGPPKPAETSTEKPLNWFWDLLAKIEKEEWGRVYSVSVWRQADSRVPMAAGEKGYLDMFTEAITVATVKTKYGGGKFRAILEKKSRYQTSHDFEIEGSPVYDFKRERPGTPAPAASDGSAAVLQQFVGVLREELQHSRESNQGGNPAGDEAIKMISSASERAMDIVLKQIPQAGSKTQELREMVATIKELGLIGGNNGGGGDGIIGTIRVLKELGLLGGQAQDPMAQLTMFMTLFEKMDALRGEGGGHGRNWKDTLAEEGVKLIPRLLEENAAAREARLQAARRGQRVGQPALPAARPAPGESAQSFADRAIAQRRAAESAPAAGNGAAPALRTVPIEQEIGEPAAPPQPSTNAPGSDWMKQRFVEMIWAGREIEDIIDFFDELNPAFCNDLSASTPEVVTAYLQADPILRRVTEHTQWPQILERGRTYLLQDEDGRSVDPAKVNLN
jgi:hypothetical protein